MDNPFASLFEAIDNSDLTDKDNIRTDVWLYMLHCCDYCNAVIKEQLYYLTTPKDKLDTVSMESYGNYRSDAHDLCIDNFDRLNGICESLDISRICDFDVSDRRKAAEFAGYAAGAMFLSNIRCEDELMKWWDECPLKGDAR